ncbi:MAG: penicillin-binding protein 1A [Alphaproteobacteria bacterium]|nr:penicillin-binding protein 1A [Alphaproteobacteria bacterium]
MRRLTRILLTLTAIVLFLGVLGLGGVLAAFWHFSRGLPEFQQLAEYEPPITTRVHAGDGRLIAEYARERRLFMPIEAIPQIVIDAFVSAEDKRFFSHAGVDFLGVARALVANLQSIGQNRRPEGASSITQQVAKNFLLSNELSYERKIKEAILAFRIERAFTKEKILELYLNEIYLGAGAYGVAAAALNYYGKSLDELEIDEAAYLAALPKAPNNYHPVRFPKAAKTRRDYVLERMAEDGVITMAQAVELQQRPIRIRDRRDSQVARSDWFAEEVRREIAARFGERALYDGGLSVRATMNPRLQEIGERTLRRGLLAYDRRHGWRKPLGQVETGPGWAERLQKFPPVPGLDPGWRIALVLTAEGAAATIGFADGAQGRIPLADMAWARTWKPDQELGPPLKSVGEALAPGDVVAVEATDRPGQFALRQIPDIGGGLVALDPHTGRILALVGGWDFQVSQFNRATQAQRQPGSAFKPFVYVAALENGFTPSSLVLDAPFVLDQGPDKAKWKPGNYSGEFYGPSTLRLGIEKSRNLMTVRLAQSIGMDKVADYARRFGIYDALPEQLSMSLGAGETTLLRLTTAYAELVNGGKRISPTLIDRVQDRKGRTIFRHDERPCPKCQARDGAAADSEPEVPDTRETVLDPATAYQMVSMLQGVVERGTGVRIRELRRPLAGKTGTSNEFFDTWFIGFSPDLVVGVFVGFDTPRTMGDKESGSAVAVPIFRDFMAEALAEKPVIPFRVPPGVRLVRIDPASGLPAEPGQRSAILEAFRPGSEPRGRGDVLDGSDDDGDAPAAGSGTGGIGLAPLRPLPSGSQSSPTTGTGGLY